jgi:hypothetical protein
MRRDVERQQRPDAFDGFVNPSFLQCYLAVQSRSEPEQCSAFHLGR